MLQTATRPHTQQAYESYYPPFSLPPANQHQGHQQGIVGIYGTYREGMTRHPVRVLSVMPDVSEDPKLSAVCVHTLDTNDFKYIDRADLCSVTVFAIVTLGGK